LEVKYDKDAVRLKSDYSSGNATKHENMDVHKMAQNKQNLLVTKSNQGTIYQYISLSQDRRFWYSGDETTSSWCSTCLRYKFKPNQMDKVLNPESMVRRTTNVLDSTGVIYGSAKMVRSDLS